MKKFNQYAGIFFASIVLTLLIIIVEFAEPFKTLLTSIFTHHWIGKLVITTVVFVVFGFSIKNEKLFGKSMDKLSFNITVLSLLIIFLFFLTNYFL